MAVVPNSQKTHIRCAILVPLGQEGSNKEERINFHCIIFLSFEVLNFVHDRYVFLANVQYMYKHIHIDPHKPTQKHICMKKSRAVYVGPTLQNDAGVSQCTCAACVTRSRLAF